MSDISGSPDSLALGARCKNVYVLQRCIGNIEQLLTSSQVPFKEDTETVIVCDPLRCFTKNGDIFIAMEYASKFSFLQPYDLERSPVPEITNHPVQMWICKVIITFNLC